MKALVACFLLSTIAVTYATYPAISLPVNYRELLERLVSKVQDDSAEVESDEDDITDLQGLFSVLEQIEVEKAKQMQYDEDGASAQFWAGLGTTLLNAGKGYLRNRYCTQEAEVRAMIEELVDEQEDNQAVEQDDDDSFTKLKNMVNTLNQISKKLSQFQASMVIDGNYAKAEGWFKKLRKSLKKKTKKLARKVLC